MTHTPGPWCRDGHNMSSVLKCVREKDDPKAKHVCGDYITVAEVTGVNWDDDAALIVAAPDLLDGAKKQVVWLQHIRERLTGVAPGSIITGIDQSLKSFRAAIAKAEGRS